MITFLSFLGWLFISLLCIGIVEWFIGIFPLADFILSLIFTFIPIYLIGRKVLIKFGYAPARNFTDLGLHQKGMAPVYFGIAIFLGALFTKIAVYYFVLAVLYIIFNLFTTEETLQDFFKG